jgi:DNA repair protein RecO (recombination protein O)
MHRQDQAICLRSVAYSETSQILTFFTRAHGKLSAIAKGSRRPKNTFDGPIEVFACGSITYVPGLGEAVSTLTEFSQQPLFRGLRSNLDALNAALLAAELTEKLTEMQDPHPGLFEALRQFLTDVQEAKDKKSILLYLLLYQLTLLSEAGIRPVLDRCTNCPSRFSDRWKTIYFSSRNNGLLCPDCEGSFVEKKRLSAPAAATLANLKTLKHISENLAREIHAVLLYHFTELLGKPPKCKME